MRNRTEEINVRVYKTEKNTIRRKAKKCGMNMSEYLRTLGTGTAVKEAPRRELMLAYQKLTTLHDTVRYELAMRDFDEALTEIESLLLRAYHGKEDADADPLEPEHTRVNIRVLKALGGVVLLTALEEP